jgi:hypothetical protein
MLEIILALGVMAIILAISAGIGRGVYNLKKNEYGEKKAKSLEGFFILLSLGFCMIMIGVPAVGQLSSPSSNQTILPIFEASINLGILLISIGFTIFTFAATAISDVYSGLETDKKIDEIHQYVKDKQTNAKKEEMEKSCRLRILRKLTTRRR